MDKLLGKKKGDKGACATLPVLSTGTSAVSRTTAGASSSSSNHLTLKLMLAILRKNWMAELLQKSQLKMKKVMVNLETSLMMRSPIVLTG